MIRHVECFVDNTRGAATIEYCLFAAVFTAVAVAGIAKLLNSMEQLFTPITFNVVNALTS